MLEKMCEQALQDATPEQLKYGVEIVIPMDLRNPFEIKDIVSSYNEKDKYVAEFDIVQKQSLIRIKKIGCLR